MQTWEQLRAELLQDPAVLAEFERLEPEYQLVRQQLAQLADTH